MNIWLVYLYFFLLAGATYALLVLSGSKWGVLENISFSISGGAVAILLYNFMSKRKSKNERDQ